MELLGATLAGCIFFPASYFSVRSWLARTWPNLTAVDRALISGSAMTALHGVLASLSGATIVYSCIGDVMHDRHWLAEWYACFCLPVFLFDIWVMYECQNCKAAASGRHGRLPWTTFWAKLGSVVAHHVISAALLLLATLLRRGLGDFIIGCFFLLEIADPFSAFKRALHQLKMTGTGIYLANEIAYYVMFILARSAIFPFMLWAYGKQHGLQIMDVPYRIPRKCMAGFTVMMALQVYWVAEMIANGLKAVTSKVSKTKKT